MAVMPVRAQFNSHVMKCSTEYVKNVIVRNYNDDELVFTYKENLSVYNKTAPFFGQYITKIYKKLANSTCVTKIAELPNGYRVYDVGFVSLKNIKNEMYHYCVFCGTQYINGLSNNIDSNGFVGYFRVGSDGASRMNDYVFLNSISNTKQLKKLAVYFQINDDHNTYCKPMLLYSGVIDAIGVPDSSIYPQASTCFVRARFCQGCIDNSYHWETTLYNSTDPTEEFVDIAATASNVVIASIYEGDTNTVWMRHFQKEGYCQYSSLPPSLSTERYTVNLSSINLWGGYLPSPLTTHFKMPVRLSPLQNEEFALSFVAYNGSTPTRKGLYSYRINLSPSPYVVRGVLDTAVATLIDVSHLPDTVATVVLAKNINNAYIVPTVRWRIVPQLSPPNKVAIFRLTNNTPNNYIQSIDAYKYSNSQYIQMGGYYSYMFMQRLQLSEHIYCDHNPATECFLYKKVLSDIWGLNYTYNFPISLTANSAICAYNMVPFSNITVPSEVICQ